MKLIFCLFSLTILVLACGSSSDDDGQGITGGAGGAAGAGGIGGVGGFRQIASEDATSADECAFLGGGGSDLIGCDYNTVTFSESLDPSELSVQVTTSNGDVLSSREPDLAECPTRLTPDPPEDDDPVLLLILNAACDATGVRILGVAETPRNSPSEIAVRVAIGDTVVGEGTFEPDYSCVEITVDDWCWRGDPLDLSISP